MVLHVNPASGVPLYIQLIEQVKHAIETGAICAGEQLPSVRQMAEDLTINPNTVARAYRELEHEGVIELKHGHGAFISESIVPRATLMQKAQAIVHAAVDKLASLNLSEDEIRRLVESELGFRGKGEALEEADCLVKARTSVTRAWPAAEEAVIAITGLTRRFAAKTVLDQVSMRVPRGSVLGLVGENGAGKTTLIKHILGLLRAEAGSVRVFGLDPVLDPVSVLSRIGYLSEQPDLPDWMRVREFMRYTRAFYPNWDDGYAEQLRQQFGLDPLLRIRVLSKGQRAKLGLLAAQAHRPDLLLLDEPSSGLDPIVRSDILAAVIRTVADEGRTVLFSSHLLEEIDRVSDHIAMLHQGRLVLCGRLEDIKAQHRRITLRFEAQQPRPPVLAGAMRVTGTGREWTMICNSAQVAVPAITASLGARVVDEEDASLNEIFVAHAAAV